MPGPGYDFEGDTGGHVRDGCVVEQGQPHVGPGVVGPVAVTGAWEAGTRFGLGVAGGARDHRFAWLSVHPSVSSRAVG